MQTKWMNQFQAPWQAPILIPVDPVKEHVQWLEQRRKGIGASDVPKILGLSNFGSPLSVYLDKLGNNPIKSWQDSDLRQLDDSPSENAFFGHFLEDKVAELFAINTGKSVASPVTMFARADYPAFQASIDRLIVGETFLECKTGSEFKKQEYDTGQYQGIPPEYYAQCQYQLYVMDLDHCWLATILGGNKYRERLVERDDWFIADMVPKLKQFWEGNVLLGLPPPASGFDLEAIVQSQLHAVKGKSIDLTNSQAEIDAYLAAQADIKCAEELRDAAKARLMQAMGDAEIGLAGTVRITWKETKAKPAVDEALLLSGEPDLFRQYLLSAEPSFDAARFKVEQPETYRLYCIETVSRQFRVTSIKGGNP